MYRTQEIEDMSVYLGTYGSLLMHVCVSMENVRVLYCDILYVCSAPTVHQCGSLTLVCVCGCYS